jgi:hypothetical protein
MEFIQIKNIPPPLHLAVARRSLNGISVTTWSDATWDQLKTFDDFRKAFLGVYLVKPKLDYKSIKTGTIRGER